MMMTSFKRARSEEQRTQRRRMILDTTAAMLAEMPVAHVSLNELSRRVGLAKSNVLRYFESREAVLLELLDAASQEWLEQLHDALTAAVNPNASPAERGDQLAGTLAISLTSRACGERSATTRGASGGAGGPASFAGEGASPAGNTSRTRVPVSALSPASASSLVAS